MLCAMLLMFVLAKLLPPLSFESDVIEVGEAGSHQPRDTRRY